METFQLNFVTSLERGTVSERGHKHRLTWPLNWLVHTRSILALLFQRTEVLGKYVCECVPDANVARLPFLCVLCDGVTGQNAKTLQLFHHLQCQTLIGSR